MLCGSMLPTYLSLTTNRYDKSELQATLKCLINLRLKCDGTMTEQKTQQCDGKDDRIHMILSVKKAGEQQQMIEDFDGISPVTSKPLQIIISTTKPGYVHAKQLKSMVTTL
ncbi:hypothetical protein KC19_10G158700 [Ceratodon purpureus]|uniref:Uncharacterized protein n=1 Tax=Ceratodon purpureus TaxID=3225 RepID=A0A8T0GPM4_CERPU|nr:hypothetical protein KC19_10G158700 [Ceratodon purpureus]